MQEKTKQVTLKEKATVYGTGNSFMKEGKAYEVHPVAAEKLIASKAATKEKPAAKEKAK